MVGGNEQGVLLKLATKLTVRSFFREFLRMAQMLKNLGLATLASVLTQMIYPESGESATPFLLGS